MIIFTNFAPYLRKYKRFHYAKQAEQSLLMYCHGEKTYMNMN